MRSVLPGFIMALVITFRPGALEISVQPEKSPPAGLDMSGGVALIRDTGEKVLLSDEGFCSVEVQDIGRYLTVEIYVPGFLPAVRTCSPEDHIEVFLSLQSFTSETVVVDMGLQVSQAVTARHISSEAAEEALTAPLPESTAGPALEPGRGFNPFVVIEAIIGESIPEILGLDD